MRRTSRRQFLKTTVVVVGASAVHGASGCVAVDEAIFPQGIASGDPDERSVVLWTRIEPATPSDDERVQLVVARDHALTDVVLTTELDARASDDHTVRVRVEQLEPGRHYHYRFVARGAASRTGRTRTAPAADTAAPVKIAFATCQDLVGRSFKAWSVLAEQQDIDLVLFLGDYVYEYESGSDVLFRTGLGARDVTFPDGIKVAFGDETFRAASSLADYRALYRQTKRDPDLQRAHELFPFVMMWDDHEFANDCWQDHATDFNDVRGDEQSTDRRSAATRAWFEFMPVDVPFHHSKSFPEDIRTYRSLRWGKHVELFVTDQRYYRDDHLIPEGPVDEEMGKTQANSPLGSRTVVKKQPFDQREAAAAPTMLGHKQRDWLVDGLRGSDATWKLWGSQTVIAQMAFDLRDMPVVDAFRDWFYFKTDQWDGFRSERRHILQSVADVEGLVALSGDIHAFYASQLKVDFDDPDSAAVGVELVVAGISSSPAREQVALMVQDSVALQLMGMPEVVQQFDALLRSSNPHFRYANSDGLGVAVLAIDGTEAEASFIEIADERGLRPEQAPKHRRLSLSRSRRDVDVL